MSDSPSSSSSSSPIDWSPSLLSGYKTLLFDCDGVLWHENDVVPGSVDTLHRLQDKGHRLIFVTNNSGSSREQYKQKLQQMGFQLNYDENSILASSYATAHYLAHCPDFDRSNHSVYVIGGIGLAEELALFDIKSVHSRDIIGDELWPRNRLITTSLLPNIGAVVVGIDDRLTYSKISYAASVLRQNPNCLFIATNRDATLPTPGHTLPGAGACVAAVATAAEREPINMGKPEPLMFELAAAALSLNKNDCLMIGDRLDTDILFGMNAGVDTLLVESGINRRADVEKEGNKIIPTYIAKDVNAML